jgi:hypothetical protein
MKKKPTSSMKLTRIRPQVYSLVFDTQYELCSTMMRMEEFYESPYKNINGKFFTLEQFMDEYAKHKKNFTYTNDWNGFNIPSDAVVAFFDEFIIHTDLLQKEFKLRRLLETIKDKKYYLIATRKKGSKHATHHELAHAYYYLDNQYRKTMDNLTQGFKYRKKLEARLLKQGYCKAVLKDEMQAYLSCYEKEDYSKKILRKKWKIPKKFKKVFEKKDDSEEDRI